MPRTGFYPPSVLEKRWLSFVIFLAFCMPIFASGQSVDETTVRALAGKFFAAYQQEDLDGLMLLWSDKSPDLAASKKSFQQTFATTEKIELKGFTVRNVTVNGEKATVRVAVEMSAADAKTGKPAAGLGKMNRTLQYVKEGGSWKVWRYVSSEEEFAAALVAAKTDEGRKARLAGEKELITVELQRALVVQGDGLVNQGNYAQAMGIYQVALSIAEQFGDKTGIATALNGTGNVYRYQGRYAQALELFQKSLKLAEETGDKQVITRALGNIGVTHKAQGNYEQALEYYQKSLKLAEEIGDAKGVARVLSNIGVVRDLQGNYEQALEYYQKSLKLAEEMGDKQGVARALGNIGVVHISQGNPAQALEDYHKCLKIVEEVGDKQVSARLLTNIGNVYGSLGNYEQALQYFQKSLKLKEELGDNESIPNALSGIGIVHEAQGNYEQALQYFRKSLKLQEESGDRQGVSSTLNNIGVVYGSQGRYAQALEYLQKSLKLAEELGDKQIISNTLTDIGITHEAQGNYAQALEYFQKGLKLKEELGDKQGISVTLNHTGIVHHMQGHYAQAVEFAQRAAAIAEQAGSAEDFWRSVTTAGRAYRALNQPDQARRAFSDVISTIEKLRSQVAGGEQQQQQFFEKRVSPYYEMVDLLIDQKNVAEAFAYAERAKGRVLLDVLSSGKLNVTKAMSPDEQSQERKLNGQLVSLNTQIYREKERRQPDDSRIADLNVRLQKARLDYEAFQTTLYAAHPELKIQRGESQPLTLKESAMLVPDANTALLEFAVMEDKTYLFVLTKQKDAAQSEPDLRVYTLNIKRKDLADRTQRFRQRLAGLDVSFFDLAGPLYDSLLKPARAQLLLKTTLVIVPDGVLWELPFQALMPARGRYLIEDCAVSYAPSLTVLREMMKLRRNQTPITAASPMLLAFGNPIVSKQAHKRVGPVSMDEKLVPLPEAAHQVKVLGQLYGPARSRIYIGAEAREDRAKLEAGKYRMLHLATHGILNDASPMYSQVVLSRSEEDKDDDGLLEAWEIMKLNLNADLVVLSACETARGRVGAGEGLIGLSWAVFVAGCPTIIVSQWKVESVSTTRLMVAFHRDLKLIIENPKSKTTKAEALRRAALKLLRSRKYNHPFYWAAFVVVGQGS